MLHQMGHIWLHTPIQANSLVQPGQNSPTKLLGSIFTLVFVLFSPLDTQQQNSKNLQSS